MKKRYLYLVLLSIPGFIVSGIISFVFCGILLGVLWIFVFGDNPWPISIEKIMPIVFALIFLPLWLACLASGFFIGKRLEKDPVLNKKHILLAIIVTILPILFIVFQQFSVGNLGPKTDGQRCSDYCRQNGYVASSIPPLNSGERTCSCLDPSGSEIIKVPLQSIDLPK